MRKERVKKEDKVLTVSIKDTDIEVWKKLKEMKASIIADNKANAKKKRRNRRPRKGGSYKK